MTKEKYWLESQGRGERLKHHAGRSEEEKVRRFYKKLVKKRKKKKKKWTKVEGKREMGVLQGSKKQLQRLMEVYTNIGAKYTKIGRGGVLNENVYISYLDDFSM